MRACSADGCRSVSVCGNKVYHQFPRDNPRRRAKWIKFVQIRRKDWSGPTEYSTLCSDHFTERDYEDNCWVKLGYGSKNKKLKLNAVPSVYRLTKVSSDTSPPIEIIIDEQDLNVDDEALGLPDTAQANNKLKEQSKTDAVYSKSNITKVCNQLQNINKCQSVQITKLSLVNVAQLVGSMSDGVPGTESPTVKSVIKKKVMCQSQEKASIASLSQDDMDETKTTSHSSRTPLPIKDNLSVLNKITTEGKSGETNYQFVDHTIQPVKEVKKEQEFEHGQLGGNRNEMTEHQYLCRNFPTTEAEAWAIINSSINDDAAKMHDSYNSQLNLNQKDSSQIIVKTEPSDEIGQDTYCESVENHNQQINNLPSGLRNQSIVALLSSPSTSMTYPVTDLLETSSGTDINYNSRLSSDPNTVIKKGVSVTQISCRSLDAKTDCVDGAVTNVSHQTEKINSDTETSSEPTSPSATQQAIPSTSTVQNFRLVINKNTDGQALFVSFVPCPGRSSSAVNEECSSEDAHNLKETGNMSEDATNYSEDEMAETEVQSAEETPEDASIHYTIVGKAAKRGNECLYDSLGFSYTKRRSLKYGCIIWDCSMRHSFWKCRATVTQKGQHFKANGQPHIHTDISKKDADNSKEKVNERQERNSDCEDLLSSDEAESYVSDEEEEEENEEEQVNKTSATKRRKSKADSDDEWLPEKEDKICGSKKRKMKEDSEDDYWKPGASGEDEDSESDQISISDEEEGPAKEWNPSSKPKEDRVKGCKKCHMYHLERHRDCPLTRISHFIENEETDLPEKFAILKTLPSCLGLKKVENPQKTVGVFTSVDLKVGTRFGPMTGEMVKYEDITRNADMEHLWVTDTEYTAKTECLSVQNETTANWLKFLRLDHTGSNYNLLKYVEDKQVYVVTSAAVCAGSELILKAEDALLYKQNKINMPRFRHITCCQFCKLDFSQKLFFQRHLYLYHYGHSQAKRYICYVCNHIEFNFHGLRHHMSTEHEHCVLHVCWPCRLFFQNENEVNDHKNEVHPKRLPERGNFKCSICGRQYELKASYNIHMSKAHSKPEAGKFQCDECNKSFMNHKRLLEHRRNTHTNEPKKKFCHKCGKSFGDGANLKIHMLTHSGVKPFKCQEKDCPIAYTTKQCLEKHYISAHKYTYKNMPKIFREVPFTMEAYASPDTAS